ncbi:MAG TPA: sulfate ABC transporter permease subunit CysT [Acidocella sp.]|uniref:sulfate ABC transporter permease subunit CysT n=1 Tax=Acidocella sp. TaxID=50710 RepID=UPI002C7CF4BE|nr:sulfate ABC transporter permease subunit CysT [Acidocella sp.]HVE21291.1 sulfate ABC transporter permease subunit CysT [Acidocella sp.]
MAAGGSKKVLPGFNLTLGYTLLYLGLVVLIPLSALVLKTFTLSWDQFWTAISSPRVLASYRLTFGASFLAALVNVVFGLLVAWVLVRYSFPGKRIVDALVDLPFALPTAVAGIALSTLYAPQGWLGHLLLPLGLRVAFTPAGIVVAMMFVSLPFIVRTVQPVIDDLDAEQEEAAHLMGASAWQIFWRISFPAILPSLLTGFALAFARCLSEYGSIIFIAGNKPMISEIVPLLIVAQLDQFDYQGATAIGTLMLGVSFLLLLTINLLQAWVRRRQNG